MTVHLVEGERFLCGAAPRGLERSYVPAGLVRSGELKPVGNTRVCPFCKAVFDRSNLEGVSDV